MAPPSPSELRSLLHRTLLDHLTPPHAEPRLELTEYAALLRDYPERGGKFLRGILTCYSALAHGASLAQAIPLGVALEMFQNWVLIHDDIEDDSDERRGRPTLHRLVGVPLALNAGDALHARMWSYLLEASLPLQVLKELAQTIELTAQGQHLDLSWIDKGRFDLEPEDYLQMVAWKSAYYTVVAPLRLGALLAGREPPEAYREGGLKLGIGFQIVDDLLNLKEASPAYGKELAGDLWEGKRTLVLLLFLREASPRERARAEALLHTPRRAKDPQEVAWLHQRLLQSQTIREAEQHAEALLREALAILKPSLSALEQPAAGHLLEHLEGLVHRDA